MKRIHFTDENRTFAVRNSENWKLHIVVKNPDHVESGCKWLTVNGQIMEDNYVPGNLPIANSPIQMQKRSIVPLGRGTRSLRC